MLRPLLHFLLIGVACVLVQRAAAPDPAAVPERLVVDAHRIEAARRAWLADTGRAPDVREDAALVAQIVDEEVLVRTARRLGFHRTDPVVWRRLVENMRFVAADPAASEVALHAEALRLRMDESDLVVRRRLVERATQALRRLGRGHEPTDDELRALVARDPRRFSTAPRIAFAQVFLSRERHGDGLADAAAAVGRALAATTPAAAPAAAMPAAAPAAAMPAAAIDARLGDPMPFVATGALTSMHEVAKTLGPGFADAVLSAPQGRWSGPFPSAYGLHFVFVRDVQGAAAAPFETVRASARYALLREREEEALTAGVDALRARFDVRIGEADHAEPAS